MIFVEVALRGHLSVSKTGNLREKGGQPKFNHATLKEKKGNEA